MPKSKARKGRKAYQPKGTGMFGVPNPSDLFLMIGRGDLGPEEEEFAAKMLFRDLTTESRHSPEMQKIFGEDWPPATWSDLVRLAKQAASPSPTPGTSHDSGSTSQGPPYLVEYHNEGIQRPAVQG